MSQKVIAKKYYCRTNCHWCTRGVQQQFENIVEENWTRLHVMTTKSLLVGNGKNLEKNTLTPKAIGRGLMPSLQTTLTTYRVNERNNKKKNNNNNNNNNSNNNNNNIIIIIIIKFKARRPDMIVVEKRNKCCKVIDFAIPYDSRIEEKEVEKVVKYMYQDLARELKKLWKMKTMVIPIVIGTFGTVPKDLKKRLENIGIETKIDEIQKSVILNTARILRKVLEV